MLNDNYLTKSPVFSMAVEAVGFKNSISLLCEILLGINILITGNRYQAADEYDRNFLDFHGFFLAVYDVGFN